MRKYSRFVVNNKLIVMIVFIVITLVISIFIPFVRVNYDDTSYLPKKSNVSQSLDEMYNSFGYGGNATGVWASGAGGGGVMRRASRSHSTMNCKKPGSVDPIGDARWACTGKAIRSAGVIDEANRDAIGWLLHELSRNDNINSG